MQSKIVTVSYMPSEGGVSKFTGTMADWDAFSAKLGDVTVISYHAEHPVNRKRQLEIQSALDAA